MRVARCMAAILLLAAATASHAAAEATIVGPTKTAEGILVYTVTSEYTKGPNAVEVLLPDRIEEGRRYPVLYVLPVDVGTGGRWGSGIQEARRTGVHNTHGLICVAPAFDTTPWYADHPTNPRVRHESYLLKVVVPLIEQRHPAMREARGRLLVGFSKSGWGAWSLLLRHPDVFGRAAAWDAPLLEQTPEKFGMADNFGTQENFERYKMTALLERQAAHLRGEPARLVLLGFDRFGPDVEQAHRRMVALGIPHVYDNATRHKHEWHSGWFADAVGHLVRPAPADGGAPREKT